MRVRNRSQQGVAVAGFLLAPGQTVVLTREGYEAWLEYHGEHARDIAARLLEFPDGDHLDALVKAIGAMSPTEFTKKGKPYCSALARRAGRDEVTAPDRNEAWRRFNARAHGR